jgi:Icc protein
VGLSRRDILIGAPGVAVGYLTAKVLGDTGDSGTERLRIAHLTDVHMVPDKGPEKRFAQALEHAQHMGADLIINGGDAIMDASKTEMRLVDAAWSSYHRILKQHNSLPVLNVLGNHDVFGWATEDRRIESKADALQRIGLDRGYYSTEKGGWKLIVLDSISYAPNRSTGYEALLGLEQLNWLKTELEATDLPVCVVSHIPIISACAFFDGQNEKTGNWTVPGEWMHLDARSFKRLFADHPNVKLCISGHIHLVDSLKYANVEYFCNGAVCGYYWKGPYQEFGPAYALVDLYPNGSYEHQMIYY